MTDLNQNKKEWVRYSDLVTEAAAKPVKKSQETLNVLIHRVSSPLRYIPPQREITADCAFYEISKGVFVSVRLPSLFLRIVKVYPRQGMFEHLPRLIALF